MIVIAFCTAILCGEIRTDYLNLHACNMHGQAALAAAGVQGVTEWTCKRGERI